jgi:DnaJ-domain-containing protein 1
MLVSLIASPHTLTMSRARLESPIDPSRRAQPRMRLCEHPGCTAGGDFRAPRSRASLELYYWFCLDHVRQYNAAWNYYAGMSEAEIEAEIRHDTTWQRPTWPLGSRYSPNHAPQMRDYFGVFGDPGGEATQETPRNKRQLSPQEAALVVFEIAPPFTLVRLKARYKELVKLHHPDAHGGDKAAEEKLKVINQAYSTLKASYFS